MSAILDRILLAVDLLLVGGVVVAGVMGEALPLPKGLDALAVRIPETPKPVAPPPAAPVPQPVVEPAPPAPPDVPPKPGLAEWERAMEAKRRARDLIEEARTAPMNDPGKKREAYTQAELFLKKAIAELKGYQALRADGAEVADKEITDLNGLIHECHKSKPMEIK